MSKHYEYFESEINGRAIYLNSTTNLKKPLASLLVLLFFSTLWTAYHISSNTLRTVQVPSGISFEAFREGLEKCAAFKRRPTDFTNRTRVNNPRRDTNSETIIFKNGNILDGLGNKIGKDVAIKDGLILSIGENLEVEGAKVIDLKKKYMSPGLVDMHSHLGVNSWPELFGTDDTNESTDPITPYVCISSDKDFDLKYIKELVPEKIVRAIDGLNPSDPALRIIASGGITTSLVLPGSANLMGGEGYVIKLRPVDTLSVEDMDINAHISFTEQKPWKWMKMACGENPKGVYGRRLKKMPKTRLGEAWLFRKRFAEAQVLKQKQDDWCDSAEKLGNNEQLNTRFPEDLSNELLVALLRGDVKLNVHCYETHDIEAFIRHSIEFKFNIAAIHHALDAYRIPSIIKRTSNEITVAIFSDLWGYKKEAFQASTKAPLILSEANIPVALKSDHPVTNAQNLVYEAAKAHHYGLSEGLALAAVTSIPAKALGLEYRIGRIAEGYDADLVIWNSHPLSLGATPLEVYIDGIPQFRASMSVLAQAPKKPISLNNSMSPDRKSGDQRKMRISSSVLITNVGKIFVNENSIMNALSRPENERMKILVQGGIVKCLGYSCDKIESIVADHVVDLEGGYVLPGIVAVGTDLGLSEIEQEPRTRDGIVASLSSPNDTHHIIHALDGLKLGGKHLDVAYKAGILTAVTAPLSRFGVVIGVSTAFKTGGITIIDDENDEIVKEAVALHFHIGTSFLDEKTPTVSSQINFLRQALIQNIEPSFTNVYGRAARGEIPVAVYTHSKDEIASLIRLKKQVNLKNGKLRLVIIGGAEAHFLAEKLAKHKIAVVLVPSRPTPTLWTAQNVLTGPPLTNNTGIDILNAHKVLLGIGIEDSGLARNLVWDAGWVFQNSGGEISEKEAVGFITWNLEKIFGLKQKSEEIKGLKEGSIADFVAYDGNPFDLKTNVRIVAGGGRKNVLINPEQD